MGYATVQHVPSLRTYGDAKRTHDSIKPLRGRSPELRPLGNRRDADTYSIRLNAEGDVECVCYRTPVVTFKKNEEIVINTDGWNTVATNQFISKVLDVSAYCNRRNTIVDIGGRTNEKFVLQNNKLTLRPSDRVGHRWDAVDFKPVMGLRMNKAAANNVMARYKEFTDYVNNLIKLRRADKNANEFDFMGTEVAGLGLNMYYPSDDTRKAFVELVQSEGTEKHYDAFLRLVLEASPSWYRNRLLNDPAFTAKVNIAEMKRHMRELILREHAKEVLEEIKLPQGKIPNPKYRDWIQG